MSHLSDKAMLVSLSQRAWKATAMDKEIASQTETQYEAEAGTMRVIKELTPREYMLPIQQIMNLGRQEHYRITLPGFTRGQHLLATAMFDRYVMIQQEIKEQFYRSVSEFCDIYPDILSEAPNRLRGAYKEADFPTTEQIKGYFEYSHRFAPVPMTNDWRLQGVSGLEMSRLRTEVEEEVHDMFRNATKEIYDRARTVLANIAQQARTYKGGFPGSAQLRDATIANLKDVSDLVLRMNITNDPTLNEIGKEMVEEFSTFEAAELRKSAELRDNIADIAERILKKME